MSAHEVVIDENWQGLPPVFVAATAECSCGWISTASSVGELQDQVHEHIAETRGDAIDA